MRKLLTADDVLVTITSTLTCETSSLLSCQGVEWTWIGFNVPLDTVQVVSQTIFPANLLTDFSANHLADNNKTKQNYIEPRTTKKPKQPCKKTNTTYVHTKAMSLLCHTVRKQIMPIYSSRGPHGTQVVGDHVDRTWLRSRCGVMKLHWTQW